MKADFNKNIIPCSYLGRTLFGFMSIILITAIALDLKADGPVFVSNNPDVVSGPFERGNPTTVKDIIEKGFLDRETGIFYPEMDNLDEINLLLDDPNSSPPLAVSGFALMGGWGDLEIAELARSLDYDPLEIYLYVYNHIDYIPSWGVQKGPFMTLMDKSGNCFDQSSLLIALLRESGYTAHYIKGTIRFGSIGLTVEQMANWLDINGDTTTQKKTGIKYLLESGGIPYNENTDFFDVTHIWVKTNIGGAEYIFDPSCKVHNFISGIDKADLLNSMGYNGATFRDGVLDGAGYAYNGSEEIGVNNLNSAYLKEKLTDYSINLIDEIKENHFTSSIEEIIGGKAIIPVDQAPTQSSLSYQLPEEEVKVWEEIPDQYNHKITFKYVGASDAVEFNTSAIYGRRLTLSYVGGYYPAPVLRLDGVVAFDGDILSTGDYLKTTMVYPRKDGTESYSYTWDSVMPESAFNPNLYNFFYGWGNTGFAIVDKHRDLLKQYEFDGCLSTSEEILGESLALFGNAWLAEYSRLLKLYSQMSNVIRIGKVTLGVTCQTGNSPYIDIPVSRGWTTSKIGGAPVTPTDILMVNHMASALESGVVSQLQQEHTAISTISGFDIVNNDNLFFYKATTNQFQYIKTTLLDDYDPEAIAHIELELADYDYILLPQNGNISLGEWEGSVYFGYWRTSSQWRTSYKIQGGYNGGYGAQYWDWDYGYNTKTPYVQSYRVPAQAATPKSFDPIDMLTGSYLYDNTDMTIGSAGGSLGLSRSYVSSNRLDDGPFGRGWTHNYDIKATISSDTFQGLGSDSPIDAAAFIVEALVSEDLLATGDGYVNMIILSLNSNWLMNQLIDNVVIVKKGKESELFVKLPDGSYNPPPDKADVLELKNPGPDEYFKLTGKSGDVCIFDNDGKATNYYDRDPDFFTPTNSLTFTYNGDLLEKVRNDCDRWIQFVYSGEHIIRVDDSTDRSTSYSIDGLGRLLSFGDCENKCTTYSYYLDDPYDKGKDLQMKTVKYPGETDVYVTNIYDLLGRVKQQTNANDDTYDYYFSDYLSKEVSPEETPPGGTAARFSQMYKFNDQGKEIGHVDQLGRETKKEYDGRNRLTSIISSGGNSVEYVYDSNHNVTKVTQKPIQGSQESDIVVEYTYNNFDKVETSKDAAGNITRNEYYEYGHDSEGLLKKIIFPTVDEDTPEIVYTYYPNTHANHGRLETVTNQDGLVTKNEYDPCTADVLKIIIDPEGEDIVIETTYDNVGNVETVKDPLGNIVTNEYYLTRRLKKTISPAPFEYETTYEYYDDGNLQYVKKETGLPAPDDWQITEYKYTNSDKKEEVINPLGKSVFYAYDSLDRLNTITDVEGNVTTSEYYPDGQLAQVTNAEDQVSKTTYNPDHGQPASVEDAEGNITEYEYDNFNRQYKTIYEGNTYEQIYYDDYGRIDHTRNRAGEEISYLYDALNRVKTKTLPGPKVIENEYYPSGKIKFITDHQTAETIECYYDDVGRLETITYPGGNMVSYQYDKAGKRKKLIYPDNDYITYYYDEMGRPTKIKDKNGLAVAEYSYDALSRRTKLEYHNGSKITYNYNMANWLTKIRNIATNQPLSYSYTYSDSGNRETMTLNGVLQQSYTYDDIYQLKTVDYIEGYFVDDTIYDYDDVGNRTSVTDSSSTVYLANDLNQYDSVGGIPYGYDDKGNLNSIDNDDCYSYNAENQLIQADATTYTYDPTGNRVKKDVDGQVTRYVYDGSQVICEYDASGALLKKIIYGPSIDEPIRMTVYYAADIDGDGDVDMDDLDALFAVWLESASQNPAADLNSDGVLNNLDTDIMAANWGNDGCTQQCHYYYHYDGLGNVIALTNSLGTTEEIYSYDVYGNPDSTSCVGNPYYFTARRLDGETGLYYYRARYYDPYIGRFLQTDPKGYEAGPNLYTYCVNNPIFYKDPFGLDNELFLLDEPFEVFRPFRKRGFGIGISGTVGGGAGGTVGYNFVFDGSGNMGIQVHGGGGGYSDLGVSGNIDMMGFAGNIWDLKGDSFTAGVSADMPGLSPALGAETSVPLSGKFKGTQVTVSIGAAVSLAPGEYHGFIEMSDVVPFTFKNYCDYWGKETRNTINTVKNYVKGK